MSDWLAPSRKDKKKLPFYLLPILMVLLFIIGINLGKLVQGLRPIKQSNAYEPPRPRYLGEVLFDPQQEYPKEATILENSGGQYKEELVPNTDQATNEPLLDQGNTIHIADNSKSSSDQDKQITKPLLDQDHTIKITEAEEQSKAETLHQQAKQLLDNASTSEENDLDFPKILPQQSTKQATAIDISIPKIKANDSLPPIPRLNDHIPAHSIQPDQAPVVIQQAQSKKADHQDPVVTQQAQSKKADHQDQDMLAEIEIEASEPELAFVIEKPAMLPKEPIVQAESSESTNRKLPNGKFWALQVQAISKGINEAEAVRMQLVMHFKSVYLQYIEVNGKQYYRIHIAIERNKQRLKAVESQYLSLFPQAEKPRAVQTQKSEGQWY